VEEAVFIETIGKIQVHSPPEHIPRGVLRIVQINLQILSLLMLLELFGKSHPGPGMRLNARAPGRPWGRHRAGLKGLP
jgi:hypothetical protein